MRPPGAHAFTCKMRLRGVHGILLRMLRILSIKRFVRLLLMLHGCEVGLVLRWELSQLFQDCSCPCSPFFSLSLSSLVTTTTATAIRLAHTTTVIATLTKTLTRTVTHIRPSKRFQQALPYGITLLP